MAKVIVMPKLGLTMTEGTLSKWLKHEGEAVKEGEPLFEVETDKLTNTIEASASGTLRLATTEGLRVEPSQFAYQLAPDETCSWPVTVAAVDASQAQGMASYRENAQSGLAVSVLQGDVYGNAQIFSQNAILLLALCSLALVLQALLAAYRSYQPIHRL